MSQILTAVTNSSGQVVKAQAYWAKPGAAPARLVVQAGQKIILQVDGQPQTGSVLIMGKRPVLRKSGKDLAVEVDGKPVVVLVDFFVAKGASLAGDEWAFAPGQGLHAQGVLVQQGPDLAAVGVSGTGTGTPKELAAVGLNGTGTGTGTTGASDLASVGVSGTTRDLAAVGVSGTTRDVAAVGVSGTTRDVAAVGVSGTNMEVAAVGLSGTKLAALAAGISLLPFLGALGKGGTDDSGSTSSLSGSVVAGPVTGGLKVQVYKAENGSLVLLGVADVAPGGAWSFNVKDYNGPMVVKVIDANDTEDHQGSNYRSELTGQAVDLDTVLLAAFNLKQGANTVNITPVTTMAALKAGVVVQGSGEIVTGLGPDFTAGKIDSNNAALAQAFALNDVLTDEVRTTIDKDTGENTFSTANAYGKVLAAIEGLGGNDQNKLESLATQVHIDGNTAFLDLAGQQDLVLGAYNVEHERQQGGLLSAVASLLTAASSDARLLIAPLGNNNIIAHQNRGAFELTVTAPLQTTGLLVAINGEPIELSIADVVNNGSGQWTVKLSSQFWPSGPNELKVQAQLSGGNPSVISTTQLFNVVDPLAQTLPITDWEQIIAVTATTEAITVSGGEGNDFLRVSKQSGSQRVLSGLAGNDYIQFVGGNSGNFTVDGGAGNDTISLSTLSTGTFELFMGDGNDRLDGGAITVGAAVWDGSGSDTLVLGSGNDTVHVQSDATNDRFTGGSGVDVLSYANHNAGLTFNINVNDAIGGKSGRVYQAAVPDVNDLFYGFESIVGGAGDDIFNVSHVTTVGGLTTVGGAGTDVLRYVSATTADLTVHITQSQAPIDGFSGTVSSAAGTNTFTGIERVYTGMGNDVFHISSAANVTVSGGLGNDTFTLSALNKTVPGGGLGYTGIWGVFDGNGDVLKLQGFWDSDTVDEFTLKNYVRMGGTDGNSLQVNMLGNGVDWQTIAGLSAERVNFSSLEALYASGHLVITG